MQNTPLNDIHKGLDARMGPFGGFRMPIQYEGILAEHRAARQEAALFDTCHMGEVRLSGATALRDLENLVTCPVASLAQGKCRYGLMCNEKGGVLDDLLVYRESENSFMIVVNAGTQDRDVQWMRDHTGADTRVDNLSGELGKVDLQGPRAPRIMQTLIDDPIDDMTFYSFRHCAYRGSHILLSRTGYTGEIGFEFYGSAELVCQFWQDCMDRGATPAGLGARDTLRLEMGMPLYGHELTENRNAAETGFSRPIARDKTFIGSAAVHGETNAEQRLVGITFEGRRAAREGTELSSVDGTPVGTVTSGSFGPSVGTALALAYIDKAEARIGRRVRAAARRRTLEGTVTSLPFYTDGTARRAMHRFL